MVAWRIWEDWKKSQWDCKGSCWLMQRSRLRRCPSCTWTESRTLTSGQKEHSVMWSRFWQTCVPTCPACCTASWKRSHCFRDRDGTFWSLPYTWTKQCSLQSLQVCFYELFFLAAHSPTLLCVVLQMFVGPCCSL